MDFLLALTAGTLGAYLGSLINYTLGYFLGARVIKGLVARYGKYIFLTPEHYTHAEGFFQKHGGITTFFGRFIPAVRQLISIPAGVFRMNFFFFSVATIVGAGLWNIILLAIGYYAADKQDVILAHLKWIIIGMIILVILYGVYRWYRSKKNHHTTASTDASSLP